MRKTKLLSLVIALCLAVISVTGCESTPEYSSTVLDKDSHTAALKEFWGEIYDMPATSADDFIYHYNEGTDEIVITDYLGNAENVRVPDTIDGHTVKRVDLKYCYKNIKSLMLPDTISFVRLAGYDDIANYIYGNDCTNHWHLSYYYVSELDGVVINDYTGTNKYVRIPETILDPDTNKEYAVRKISFMERHKDIDCLIIPDSVKYVYAEPYEDVIVYESEINNVLTDTHLNDVHLYENIGVEKMNIPAALSQDTGLAFSQSTLKGVYIPDNFKTIPKGMFQESKLLCEVTLRGNDIDIQDNAFYKCSSLTEFDLSKALSIGDAAFYGCTGISEITFNPKLTSIGAGAFASCIIKDVTIPASVKSIGNYAFKDCSSLESLAVEDGNMFYYSEDNVLYSKETSKPIGYEELVNN